MVWHDALADTLNYAVKSTLPYLPNFYFDFEETKSKGHKKTKQKKTNQKQQQQQQFLFQAITIGHVLLWPTYLVTLQVALHHA